MNSSPQAGTTTNPPQSLPNPTQGTPKVTLPTFGMNPGTSQDTTTPIRPGILRVGLVSYSVINCACIMVVAWGIALLHYT